MSASRGIDALLCAQLRLSHIEPEITGAFKGPTGPVPPHYATDKL